MYYLLSAILFIVLYYVFMRILSSVIKGCLSAFFVFGIAIFIIIMVKSTKAPVDVFGLYTVDNLKITRIIK